MRARLLFVTIGVALAACGEGVSPKVDSPTGTWRVENVAEAVSDVHAESIRAMEEVLTALGPRALPRDRETGLQATKEVDDAVTDRLVRALVTFEADGTFAWTPAPFASYPETSKKLPADRMDGRWSLADGRISLDVAKVDGRDWAKSPLRFLGAFEGSVVRLTDLSSIPRSAKGLRTLVLRRVP